MGYQLFAEVRSKIIEYAWENDGQNHQTFSRIEKNERHIASL
jgi:hypothetical protein